jgi:hypothetical protein
MHPAGSLNCVLMLLRNGCIIFAITLANHHETALLVNTPLHSSVIQIWNARNDPSLLPEDGIIHSLRCENPQIL